MKLIRLSVKNKFYFFGWCHEHDIDISFGGNIILFCLSLEVYSHTVKQPRILINTIKILQTLHAFLRNILSLIEHKKKTCVFHFDGHTTGTFTFQAVPVTDKNVSFDHTLLQLTLSVFPCPLSARYTSYTYNRYLYSFI